MSVTELVLASGGVASYRWLVRHASRAELERAVAGRDLVRVARGRFALPVADEAAREAHALAGVVSHLSAALAWGWAVKLPPDRPHVTVPDKRRVRTPRRVHLHRRDLLPEQVSQGRTSRDLTLEQCLRTLPYDEALAVADSALRDGFDPARLRAIARDARGPGGARLRAVAARADPAAASPFESVLRAICHAVDGLHVRPQVWIGEFRPDLVDEDLCLVLEADSFEWHGNRRALKNDARRYNELVVQGWLVLRFVWEDVMHQPARVHAVLERAVAQRQGFR